MPPAHPPATKTALRSVLLVVAGMVLGGAAIASISRADRDPPAALPSAPSASVSSAPPPISAPSTSALPTPSVPAGAAPSSSSDALGLAASGDLDALKRLEGKDEHERSLDDALAIARGHAVLARRDLEALARAVEKDPALAHDRATLARFHDFVEREPVALDALAAIARVPGPESADMLQAIWRRRRGTTIGLFARDLVRGKAARDQTSEALGAVIDLEELIETRSPEEWRVERRCQKAKERVARVAAVGDRRAIPLLAEIEGTRGCGLDGGADCYSCLREGDLLARAKEAASKREAPTPWILPGR